MRRVSGVEPSLGWSFLSRDALARPAHPAPSEGHADLVSVWEEVSHLFTGIYRAALTSAADVTRVSETHASDEAYAAASAAFEPNDLVDLTVRMTAPGASGTSASNRGR